MFAQSEWSAASRPTTQNLWSVTWGLNTFVAVGENGAIVTSPDGLTWTPRVSGSSHWLVGVGHGNGLFVIVGAQGTILTSPDGIAWTARTSGTTARINGVAFGGGRWLAVAESGDVLSATDAFTWTRLAPSTDRLRGLTHAYGQFVITGDNGLMRTTVDTIDYAAKVLPEGLFVESVVHARRTFLAVGEDGYALRSDDAVNWQRVATGTTAYLPGVAHFNGVFIAVGANGAILTTPDPSLAWTPRISGTTALLTSVAASNAAIVVVGFNGTILRSTPTPALPTITEGPRSISDTAGSNVLLEVTATGSPPLTHQWHFQGQPLSGQTSDRLLLANVQASNVGHYTVTVRNPLGNVTSAPATVSLATSTAPGPIVDPIFAPTLTFPSSIATAVEQTDGKLIIGGSQFFVTGGVSPFPLARLNPDGSFDPTFSPGPGFNSGATVSTLVVQPDGKILVGGRFSSFNGVTRSNSLRLTSDGLLDPTFSPPPDTSPSPIVIQADGKILVHVGRRLVRLNLDGSIDPAFTGPGQEVYLPFFVLLPDGGILGAGEETLGQLRPDGTVESTWTTKGQGSVIGMQRTAEGRVFIARRNSFGSVNVRRQNANGSDDLTWPGIGASIRYFRNSLGPYAFAAVADGKIVHAYTERMAIQIGGGTHGEVARFTASGSRDISFHVARNLDAPVTGIVPLRDGKTILFGEFSVFDGVERSKIVRLVAANAPEAQPPKIVSVTPEAVAVRPGEPVTITVSAAGSGPLTYTWNIGPVLFDNTGASLIVPTSISGTYTVTAIATNRVGSTTSAPVRVVVAPSAPILVAPPVSTAVRAGQNAVLTVAPGGSAPFTYEWFRGTVRVGTGQILTLTNVTAADSDDYTVVIRNSLGVATSQPARLTIDTSARLTNISTRATIAPGEQILIAGFVVSGAVKKDLLIRGAGPALAGFGVNGALADPLLVLTTATGVTVASNDNWATNANAADLAATNGRAGAFPLAAASRDAAILVTLPPGNYTALVSGSANTTGIALVEVYEVP